MAAKPAERFCGTVRDITTASVSLRMRGTRDQEVPSSECGARASCRVPMRGVGPSPLLQRRLKKEKNENRMVNNTDSNRLVAKGK